MEEVLAKVRRQSTSGTPSIARPATVLVALESSLSSSNDAALPAEAYFAALVSTLEQLGTDDLSAKKEDKEREELRTSTLYLLALVLPFVQPGVARSKAATLLHLLNALSALPSQQEDAPTSKSLLGILAALLATLPAQQLAKPPSKSALNYLRQTALDPRPKVRKKAQETLASLLSTPCPPAAKHPYAAETAGWAVKGLEQAGKELRASRGQENKLVEGKAGALIALVKALGAGWDEELTPALLSALLALLSLPSTTSAHLPGQALSLLTHLFSASRVTDLELDPQAVEQTFKALLEAAPKEKAGEGERAEKAWSGWVESVAEGAVALSRTSPSTALRSISDLYSDLLLLLSSSSLPLLRNSISTSLDLLTRHCLPSSALAEQPLPKEVQEILKALEGSFTNPRFAGASTPHLFTAATALFTRFAYRPPPSSSSRASSEPLAATALKPLFQVAFRRREARGFEYRNEADKLLLAALRVCGPEWVLELAPLNVGPLAKEPNKGRAWLLPLLRDGVRNARLAHWLEMFGPTGQGLAGWCAAKAKVEEGDRSRVWQTLEGQCWDLLSGYVSFARDLEQEWEKVVPFMLEVMVDDDQEEEEEGMDVDAGAGAGADKANDDKRGKRVSVLKALRAVAESTRRVLVSTAPAEVLEEQFGLSVAAASGGREALRRTASEVLQSLFGAYGAGKRSEGGLILEVVVEWVGLLEVKQGGEVVIKVLGAAEKALRKRKGDQALGALDILGALVPYVCAAGGGGGVVERTWALAASKLVLEAEEGAVQKRGYKILKGLVEGTRGKVVRGREGEVLRELEGEGEVAAGAKQGRLALLATLVPLLPGTELHLIPALIPEACLLVKESNEKVREGAFDLLVELGRKVGEEQGAKISRAKVIDEEDEMEEDGMEEVEATYDEFFRMVEPGLAAKENHLRSATVLALGRLVWEFHENVPDSTLTRVVDQIVDLLALPNREIARSALGFLKVSLACLPVPVLEGTLPLLVPNLLNWTKGSGTTKQLKVRTKQVLDRLIRKFGTEGIEAHVEGEDKKLIAALRKKQQKAKKDKDKAKAKKAREAVAGDEEDSDREAARPVAGQRSAFEEALYGSDDDDSSDGAESEQEEHPRPGKGKGKGGKKDKKKEVGTYLVEEEDEVLDLLDEKMMSRVSANRGGIAAQHQSRKPLDSHFETDSSTGKYKFGAAAPVKPAAASTSAFAGTSAYVEAMAGEDGHTMDAKGKIKFNKTQGKKRGRDADEDDVAADLQGLSVGGGAGGGRQHAKSKKLKQESVKLGAEFKAKKAGGDLKKDGMSPYAYLPLNAVAGKKKGAGGAAGPRVDITGRKHGR